MTMPAYDMPEDLLAALKSDFAVPGRWKMVGAYPTLETTTAPNPDPLLPPVETVQRLVTVTLSCAARSLSLVAMLKGADGFPASSLLVSYMGSPWRVADAELIARITSGVEPMMTHRAAELLAKLEEPLP